MFDEEAQDEQDELVFALRALKKTRELLHETSQGAALEIVRLKDQRDAMLEALEEIANMGVPVQKTEHRIARAAIAKAKGEDNE